MKSLTFALCLSFLGPVACQANFKLVATKVESDFNPEILNVSCRLENFANDSYSLSFRFRVLEDAEKLFVRVAIALPTTNGEYKSIIANTVQDVCKYVGSKNSASNPLLKLFFNGNCDKRRIPTSCPVRAGDYFVENFRLGESVFKMRMMETKFLVTVEFWPSEVITAGDCTATLRIYGEIREMKRQRKAAAKV